MPEQAAPCKAGQAAPPQPPHTASLGRGARGLCVPGSPRQHSTALGTAALLLQRCCGGHQCMPSTAVENESLHSTWMLLPPCLPSEGLQKWRSGRSHLTATMKALRWPKPAVLSWGTARRQQQQAQLAFPPLQSVCTKPFPSLERGQESLLLPCFLRQHGQGTVSRLDVLCPGGMCYLCKHTALPKEQGWALPLLAHLDAPFNHHRCSNSPCKCSAFR